MKVFRHRLDIYYMAAIAYGVTFSLYVLVRGSMVGNKFEMVWRDDPIVYLLAAAAVISLVVLLVMAYLGRTILVDDNKLIFRTRFKDRTFTPAEIEFIGVRRDKRTRVQFGRVYPVIVIRLKSRVRMLRLRPDNFEQRADLVREISEWATRNNVELRSRWRKRFSPTKSIDDTAL